MPVCSNITYSYDSGIFFVETQFLSVTIVRMTVTPIFAKLASKKETMKGTGSMFSWTIQGGISFTAGVVIMNLWIRTRSAKNTSKSRLCPQFSLIQKKRSSSLFTSRRFSRLFTVCWIRAEVPNLCLMLCLPIWQKLPRIIWVTLNCFVNFYCRKTPWKATNQTSANWLNKPGSLKRVSSVIWVLRPSINLICSEKWFWALTRILITSNTWARWS